MSPSISIMIIAAALSLGIFAEAARRGANIVTLDLRLFLMSAIWGLLSLGAASLGYGVGRWILAEEKGHFHAVLLAGILLALIGAEMLLRTFRGKTFLEHRMERIDIKADTLLSLRLCLGSLVAGTACGLQSFGFRMMIAAFFCLGLLCAVLGYYTGRFYGPLFSRRAQLVGGGLLLVVGVAMQFA